MNHPNNADLSIDDLFAMKIELEDLIADLMKAKEGHSDASVITAEQRQIKGRQLSTLPPEGALDDRMLSVAKKIIENAPCGV